MEKDVGKIPKNADTDIMIRVDDFGGRIGVTIREFVKGERYTGFTKAGTRIPAEHFKAFKDAINSISEKDLVNSVGMASAGIGSAGIGSAKSGGSVGGSARQMGSGAGTAKQVGNSKQTFKDGKFSSGRKEEDFEIEEQEI